MSGEGPDPDEVSGGPAGRPIGRALDDYLASEGLSSVRVLASLAADWTRVVGAGLGAHSAPRAIEGKQLVVAVDHPSRVAELAFVSERVCNHIAEQVGYRLIEHLKGRVDPRLGLE